jgi:cob(I)alamin adenosyltransferase
MSYKILVSNGEIIDKFSILEIKVFKSQNILQTQNIQKEINELLPYINIICNKQNIKNIYQKLKNVNNELWAVEDKLRKKEQQNIFDEEFISLARNVYKLNDKRAEYKKEINLLTKSILIEEKIYEPY